MDSIYHFIYQFSGWGTHTLELVVGVIFVVHGWAKLRDPSPIGQIIGDGRPAGIVFGLIEVGAGLMIATGLGTFYSSLAIIVIMLGALYHKIVKWHVPFKADATGWEFDLLILVAALTLLLG